jgi:hypothetical protein
MAIAVAPPHHIAGVQFRSNFKQLAILSATDLTHWARHCAQNDRRNVRANICDFDNLAGGNGIRKLFSCFPHRLRHS